MFNDPSAKCYKKKKKVCKKKLLKNIGIFLIQKDTETFLKMKDKN